MPFMPMYHDTDPAQELLSSLGNLNDIDIFNNQVLVAIYVRPNKTKSGIILTDSTRDEDRYQGKVGLVVKKGPSAFVDESEEWFKNNTVNLHNWVIFQPASGWGINVNGVLCRVFDDVAVRGKISRPDMVW